MTQIDLNHSDVDPSRRLGFFFPKFLFFIFIFTEKVFQVLISYHENSAVGYTDTRE